MSIRAYTFVNESTVVDRIGTIVFSIGNSQPLTGQRDFWLLSPALSSFFFRDNNKIEWSEK